MPRPRDLSPMPVHPAIIGPPYLGHYLARNRMMVLVRCPRCLKDRERTASETRREATRPNFKGYCRRCAIASVKDGTHRWYNYKRTRPRNPKHINNYLYVSPRDVTADLLPIYRRMQRSGQAVLQHRLVMAEHLARALESNELVDHMNGNKTDNRLENLRLYVRGKQQPGSAPGYGTYYHEWQTALQRVRTLELLLIECGTSPDQAPTETPRRRR